MFDTYFENTYINCLNSSRNICVLLKDDLTDDIVSAWSLTMRTISPQKSVSVFEFDASSGELNEEEVAAQMLKRIRNFTSSSSLAQCRKPLSSIYFAAGVLQDAVLVIHYAENLSDEFYLALEKIEKALRVSQKGRLRVLMIGKESIIPMVARNTARFKKVKWYNALREPKNASELLSSLTTFSQNESVQHTPANEQNQKDLIYFGESF